MLVENRVIYNDHEKPPDWGVDMLHDAGAAFEQLIAPLASVEGIVHPPLEQIMQILRMIVADQAENAQAEPPPFSLAFNDNGFCKSVTVTDRKDYYLLLIRTFHNGNQGFRVDYATPGGDMPFLKPRETTSIIVPFDQGAQDNPRINKPNNRIKIRSMLIHEDDTGDHQYQYIIRESSIPF